MIENCEWHTTKAILHPQSVMTNFRMLFDGNFTRKNPTPESSESLQAKITEVSFILCNIAEGGLDWLKDCTVFGNCVALSANFRPDEK